MKDIYKDNQSEYLSKNKTWHAEDSEWKAAQINDIINRNNLNPQSIVEIGCGAGEILVSLDQMRNDSSIVFEGYDIAKDALAIARRKETSNIKFHLQDFTKIERSDFDMLLMIDVFEHVPDYIGFIEKCKSKAKVKIYHIPLDISFHRLLRNGLIASREKVGHLHYFTKETALATIEDTGQKIIDFCYTDGALALSKNNSLKSGLGNLARKALYPIAPDKTVTFFGGYSLLVLAE